MTQVMIDPQASGWRDDNAESGVQRAELVRAGLVAVPFRRDQTSFGSGTSMSQLFPGNGDGTNSGVFVSVTSSGSLGGGTTLGFWVFGTTVGIRMDRVTTSWSGNPVGCLIDGIAYEIDNSKLPNPTTQVQTTTFPNIYGQILATDLPNTLHWVELAFPQSTTTSRTWGVFGYLADAAAGYAPVPRGLSTAIAPVQVTTSFVPLFGLTTPLYGVKKLVFSNTTAGAITANVRWSSNTAMWSRPVPANDTIEFDPGGIIYDGLSVSASGLGVNCQIVGAC